MKPSSTNFLRFAGCRICSACILLALWILTSTSVICQGNSIPAIPGNYAAVTISDSGAVLALTGDGGAIERADAIEGELNSVLSMDGSDKLYDIVSSSGTAVAVGTDGLIYRSTDDGQTWSAANFSPLLGNLVSLASNGDGRWLAAGNHENGGAIVVSNDDGVNWTLSNGSPSVMLNGIVYDSVGGRWLAVGGDVFDGYVFESSDSGNSWSTLPVPEGTAFLNAVAVSPDGSFVAVGESGTIVAWNTGTDGFILVGFGLVSENLQTVAAIAADNWIIGGDQRLILRFDGQNVSIFSMPVPGMEAIRDILIIDENYYFTSNFPQPVPYHEISLSILSIDLENGMIQVELTGGLDGIFYELEYTDDLLNAWHPVLSSSRQQGDEPVVWSLSMSEDKKFWRARAF